MPLWKTTLSYDGTAFHGWQVQPSLPTIQGALAHALLHITGETVLPQGSGRTDTGVHALGQVASFSLEAPIPAPSLHRALNRALPPSIRVLTLEAAPPSFHARHSALAKTYEYRIFPARPTPATLKPDPMPLICSPMLAPYVWDCPLPLNLPTLQNAAAAILGTHDFTSFAAADPDLTTRNAQPQIRVPHLRDGSIVAKVGMEETEPLHATNTRTIHHSSWNLHDHLLVYRVTSNGFLHHMVRNLVGTFVEAATGRIHADDIPKILAVRNRSVAGPTAPARGLFLMEVTYE